MSEPGAEDSGAARGAIPKSGGGDGPAAERSARVPRQGGALVIGVWGALAGALVLLLVCSRGCGRKHRRKILVPTGARQIKSRARRERGGLFTGDCFAALFRSRLKFISGLESPGLENLFRRERTAVALHWCKKTSAFISKVMRRHLKRAACVPTLRSPLKPGFSCNTPGSSCIADSLCAHWLARSAKAGRHGAARRRFIQRVGEGLVEFQSAAQLREPEGSESL